MLIWLSHHHAYWSLAAGGRGIHKKIITYKMKYALNALKWNFKGYICLRKKLCLWTIFGQQDFYFGVSKNKTNIWLLYFVSGRKHHHQKWLQDQNDFCPSTHWGTLVVKNNWAKPKASMKFILLHVFYKDWCYGLSHEQAHSINLTLETFSYEWASTKGPKLCQSLQPKGTDRVRHKGFE